MKRRTAVVVIAGLIASQTASTPPLLWPIGPGEYVLRIAAREGTRRGSVTGGHVTLVATSSSDRSPRTGEKVPSNRSDPRHIPVYGWTDVDLHRVGAPLCDEGPAPLPGSRDPVFPGVLVLTLDPAWALEANGVRRPKDGPIVVIGTLSNMRDGRLRLDGCGIGLFGQSTGRACMRGVWAEWGLAVDGRGVFELCRVGDAA
jgi:hypothetical protein